MAVRPVEDPADISAVPVMGNDESIVVWKRFDGELLVRDADTPDSDVGATSLVTTEDLENAGLTDILPIPVVLAEPG